MPCGASATCCANRAVFPSIRAQLTAWLALLVILCLAAFAVYLYVAVGQRLTADLRLDTQAVPHGALLIYSLPVSDNEQTVGLVVVAASLDEIRATTRVLLGLLVAGGLGVVLLAVLGGGVLVRRGLRPLEEMASVAEGITARRLDQRMALRAPPREVGRLAGTFNAMLDRLHAAFETQRRFVADASHELRTPLATIRGRSEVLLLSPTLDPEAREGLVLIRDEAGRMARLVANLLLLAPGGAARAIARPPVELAGVLLDGA